MRDQEHDTDEAGQESQCPAIVFESDIIGVCQKAMSLGDTPHGREIKKQGYARDRQITNDVEGGRTFAIRPARRPEKSKAGINLPGTEQPQTDHPERAPADDELRRVHPDLAYSEHPKPDRSD